MPTEMTFECPSCGEVGRVEGVESETSVTCRACGSGRPIVGGAFRDGGLSACPFCATEDLYIQKDFPHGLGLAIVLVGFAVSTVFWFYYMPVASLAVLLASAALDLILYYLVPDVTICYRCLSQFRGPGTRPDGRFSPFDLAIGERYRQERLRVEELRKRGQSAVLSPSIPGGDGPEPGRSVGQ